MSDGFAGCVKDKISGPASVVLMTFYDIIKCGLTKKKEIIDALEKSSISQGKMKHLDRAIKMLRLKYVPEVIVDSSGKMQDLKSNPPKYRVDEQQACELYNYMKDCINSAVGGGRKRKNKYRGKKTKKISKKRRFKKRRSKKKTKRLKK